LISKQRIVGAIQSLLSDAATLLYAAIVGSRAKEMASSTSDYDIKAIVLHSKEKYLLQQVKSSGSFATEVDGIEIEGTFTDYLTMQKYILDTNMAAYETFAGICIYTTPAAEGLKSMWLQSYESEVLRASYRGMLTGYKHKKLKKDPDTPGKTTCKLAAEAMYLVLKLLYFETDTEQPPPFSVFELMDQATQLTGEQRDWLTHLIRRRIADKDAAYYMPADLVKLMDEVLSKDTTRKRGEKEPRKELVRQEAEEAFLRMVA